MTHFVGIDPSTKTGFVRIDQNGNVVTEYLFTCDVKEDVERLATIAHEVVNDLRHDDLVCIESISYGSKGSYAIQQGALGIMIRANMQNECIKYIDAAPTQLKKFISGNHQAKKEALILPLYKKYGYENDDDNIRDAFGLAQIARAVRMGTFLDKKQEEVVRKVLQSAKA